MFSFAKVSSFGDLTGFQFLACVAGMRTEADEFVAESNDRRVLFPGWQERVFPADIFCIGDDVGKERWASPGLCPQHLPRWICYLFSEN